MMKDSPGISFIVPAYNEEENIRETLLGLKQALDKVNLPYEIILVDDGSTDQTASIAKRTCDTILIHHPTRKGYGNSIKSGVVIARFDWIGIIDADMSYPIQDIPVFVGEIKKGTDMAIGNRYNILAVDKAITRVPRLIFITLVRELINGDIRDPNCGMRLFKRTMALEFMPDLCGTFSFTTSLTLTAKRKGYSVKYIPIEYSRRRGKSKVNYVWDSLRAARIVFWEAFLFYPVKLIILLSAAMIMLISVTTLYLSLSRIFLR